MAVHLLAVPVVYMENFVAMCAAFSVLYVRLVIVNDILNCESIVGLWLPVYFVSLICTSIF